MKRITALHKQIRVARFNKNLAKSLSAHDLRFQTKEQRTAGIDESRSHLNSYTFRGVKLETEEQRREAETYINSLFENDNKQFDAKTFSQQKFKLKKWLNADKTTDTEKELYLKILDALDNKKEKNINYDIALKRLSKAGKVSRFNDKKKAITSVIDLHNQRINLDVDQTAATSTRLVSVLLKIPGHNNTEIPVEAQERLMNSYYSDTLPDYEIVLSTNHKDEDSDHNHLIIDAKNTQTGKYDFVQKQYEYVKDKFDLSSFPESYSKLNADELRKFGELLQEDFYNYSNNFLKMLGYSEVFSKKEYESDEQKNAERQKIAEDTNKPMWKREYNMATLERERRKKLQSENQQLVTTNENLEDNAKNAVMRLIDYATAYAVDALEKPLDKLIEAISGVYAVNKQVADKTVEESVDMQQEEHKKKTIQNIYNKVKKS